MESKNEEGLVKMGVLEQLIDQPQRIEDDGDHTRLLSKFENLRREEKKKNKDRNDEIIIRELGKLKKQNFITHCLLSAMIVLTLTWQLSEVSMIFKLKHAITHPFRSISQFIGLNKTIQAPPSILNELLPPLDLKNDQEDDE